MGKGRLNYLERFALCASKKSKHENLIHLSQVVWFAFGSRYENQVKGHYIINNTHEKIS